MDNTTPHTATQRNASAARKLYIDGRWIDAAQGQTFATLNPADESALASVAAAGEPDIALAVQAARRAFDEGPWPAETGRARAQILRRIAQLIREQRQQLAELEVSDNGKPLPEALWDIDDASGCFDYYATLAERMDDEAEPELALPDARFSCRVRKEPVGVVAAIVPWNFPFLMAAWKVAPALAAGCCVVLKPSELTPLTALELAKLADHAGLPPGALNVVTGLGTSAGAALSRHVGVDKLAFTGSVPTGIKVMQAAARDIKQVSLELGGKSPLIVFADIDIRRAVEWIMFGIFWNQGEVCSATSRVLVQRALYAPLLECLAEATRRITIGDGMTPDVLLGPLISRAHRDKVLTEIAGGIRDGARLIAGGRAPTDQPVGYFLEPTIFADVAENSRIWREEIFGPVVCLRPFDDEQEAVRIANDSRFGLAAAVMSADLQRADRVARRLRAGIVWINCSQPTFTEAPWGGYKHSGIGRELGEWGLNNYLEIKQITRYDSDQPWGWYLK